MSYPGGWRPHIEQSRQLRIQRLADVFQAHAGAATFHWSGGTSADCRYTGTDEGGTLTVTMEGKVQRIGIVCVPWGFARRWMFVCPSTGRRVLVLYRWPGMAGFCCRQAITPAPTYLCQRLSGLDRANRQRVMLRRKLGEVQPDLLHFPDKPKWQRWDTYARHWARAQQLDRRAWAYLLAASNRYLRR